MPTRIICIILPLRDDGGAPTDFATLATRVIAKKLARFLDTFSCHVVGRGRSEWAGSPQPCQNLRQKNVKNVKIIIIRKKWCCRAAVRNRLIYSDVYTNYIRSNVAGKLRYSSGHLTIASPVNPLGDTGHRPLLFRIGSPLYKHLGNRKTFIERGKGMKERRGGAQTIESLRLYFSAAHPSKENSHLENSRNIRGVCAVYSYSY